MSSKGRAKIGPDGMTLKQRRWVQEYFKTGNATQAALKVYDAKDAGTAANIGSQNVRKLQAPIRTLMEAKGLSIGKLVDVVLDATEATKIIVSPTEPDREVKDHYTRLKAAQIAGKWLGMESDYGGSAKVQVNVINEIKKDREEYGFIEGEE